MEPQLLLGKNLRRLREATGVSQERFALEHGFDRTYISGIERGVRNPTVRVIGKLALALQIEPHVLLSPFPD